MLTTGGVDCWGYGLGGEFGNGTFYPSGNKGSATPIQVEGVGGDGTLEGVSAVAGDGFSPTVGSLGNNYCALLTTSAVACWGEGSGGQLGNGVVYPSGNDGSATPVQVVAVDG